MCFGCSKEPSHLDGSFEFPQPMFWLRNKIKKYLFVTNSSKGLNDIVYILSNIKCENAIIT